MPIIDEFSHDVNGAYVIELDWDGTSQDLRAALQEMRQRGTRFTLNIATSNGWYSSTVRGVAQATLANIASDAQETQREGEENPDESDLYDVEDQERFDNVGLQIHVWE